MAVDINPVVYWVMALCCLVGGTKSSEECTISVFVSVMIWVGKWQAVAKGYKKRATDNRMAVPEHERV